MAAQNVGNASIRTKTVNYLSLDRDTGGEAAHPPIAPKVWLLLPIWGDDGGVKRETDLSWMSGNLHSRLSPVVLLLEAVAFTTGECVGLFKDAILEGKCRLSSPSRDWGPPLPVPLSLFTLTSLMKGMNTWFDSSSEL